MKLTNLIDGHAAHTAGNMLATSTIATAGAGGLSSWLELNQTTIFISISFATMLLTGVSYYLSYRLKKKELDWKIEASRRGEEELQRGRQGKIRELHEKAS